jgi:hypothetical protein
MSMKMRSRMMMMMTIQRIHFPLIDLRKILKNMFGKQKFLSKPDNFKKNLG